MQNHKIQGETYHGLDQKKALVILNNIHDLSFLIWSLEEREKLERENLVNSVHGEGEEKRERESDIERERVTEILREKEEISCLRWREEKNQRLRSIPHLKTIQICSSNRLRIDSVSQSIENRFTAVLVSDPISWSIENRFICSLDSPCLADLLIDWESIRLLSGFPLA